MDFEQITARLTQFVYYSSPGFNFVYNGRALRIHAHAAGSSFVDDERRRR